MSEEREKDDAGQARPQRAARGGVVKAPEADPKEFRRQAALAILSAFVARHGGFRPEDMDAHMRLVWEYADRFAALEDAPPLPRPGEFDVPAAASRPAADGPAAAHPADEWAVHDGGKRHGGFVSRAEAEWFAAKWPGARVVQVGGPGAERGKVADPAVVA